MAVDLERLERVLAGAAVWGLELDPRYRVLAATFEPTEERYPGEPPGGDRRIQVLFFPVATILASFRRLVEGRRQLHTFTDEQLVDVAAAFGGGQVHGPVFGRPEPRPGQWGPQFSMEGRSTAPDGTRHTCTIELRADDLELDVFARFDEAELKAADGRELTLDPLP